MVHSGRCSRPACGAHAVAVLTYDHARALAWIDEPGIDGGWPLCSRHAERLTVPQGWDLRDRRAPNHLVSPTREIRIAS